MEPLSRQPTNNTSLATRSFEDDPAVGGCRPRLSIPGRVAGRDRSPGLQWHRDYNAETKLKSRVLMIDYVRRGVGGSHEGRRRVVALEIHDLATLKSVYEDGRDTNSTLRVFHVQNCTWARRFLIHKFRIKDNDDIVGLREFGDWLLQKRPQRRAGKPLLVGKSWKTTADPWRGVTKCSFGMDYMKHYACGDTEVESKETCVVGLMGYDENDNPVHRYNVYSQRLSVYVQYAAPGLQTPGPDVVSPYQCLEHGRPVQELYDNGSTIIVFDSSETGSIYDSLISARGEWESRWRRLPFYLANDYPDEDEKMTLECMKVITQDIFKAIANCWDQLLDASWEHVSILEEKIYEQPADESRAPELWSNSAHWLKYEKLMFYHIDVVNEMRKYLVEIDGDLSDEGLWLRESPEDFDRLSSLIEEDLVKRTNNLSELMYKSVGIRDSRQSLQLGTSMWRLSWITFIFLPLTFIVGFFGMSVDTFADNPSIKWYFIVTVPFMAAVLVSWYLLKHWLTRHRQSPHERGVYEALYADLHSRRPELWSRAGPRNYIQPKGRASKIKWWLMLHWMSPKRLLPPRPPAGQILDDEPVGAYNRLKRYLVRKWTPEIEVVCGPAPDPEAGLALVGTGVVGSGGAAGLGLEGENGMARPALGLHHSEEEDVVLAVGVEGGRNSGVLVEEQIEGSPEKDGMGLRLKVPESGGGR
ncbi:unnamed protein product [Tuber melanosporum]|uniref:(Perigord truffle) hypothetical protein n=1 Tax=Tuber melanosporum (strain Mel28) TaxID=656061 RepID=D5G573_TUBMM|nr:uncharacterized protein GSTUM_00000284001 [Tuber melanosporum]CAZ79658.1 unnamed protein product [Tuber melanosporum]